MADAWIIEEINHNGDVVWECIVRQRPVDMQWYKDMPSKTHTLRITALNKDMDTVEIHKNIKSLKDATKRMVEANIGL